MRIPVQRSHYSEYPGSQITLLDSDSFALQDIIHCHKSFCLLQKPCSEAYEGCKYWGGGGLWSMTKVFRSTFYDLCYKIM